MKCSGVRAAVAVDQLKAMTGKIPVSDESFFIPKINWIP
jgi:hypothetical protein